MRAFVLLTLSTLCHAVFYAWLLRVFPSLKTKRRLVLASFAPFVLMAPVGRIVVYRLDSPIARVLTALAMAELLVVLMALVPMLTLRGLSALYTRFFDRGRATLAPVAGIDVSATPAPASVAVASPEPTAVVTRREALERAAGLAILGASGASIGWGVIKGRLDFQIEEVVVKIPGLPRALEGYTIAQVSDIHVGLFVRESELKQGLSLIARTKPDLVVATGDLVDFDSRYIPLMARTLADLRTNVGSGVRDGVAAILGNHDYYTDGADIRDALNQAGVRALVNQHAVLRSGDGGGFVLAGVDDFAGARYGGEGPDLARALRGAPAVPRILLAHQPQFFNESRGQVALQLSGHIHGGQINPIVHPAKYLLKYVAGRYESNGSTMWVNRGFGTAGPPARIGSPPEITRIVLISG